MSRIDDADTPSNRFLSNFGLFFADFAEKANKNGIFHPDFAKFRIFQV